MLVELGVQEGDRVAIYRENSAEWFELYHGIVGMGAIAVPVDAKLREREVRHIFRDCGVSVIFASCRLAETLEGMHEQLPDLRTLVMLDCVGKSQSSCNKIEHETYEALWQQVDGAAASDDRAFDRMGPIESSISK